MNNKSILFFFHILLSFANTFAQVDPKPIPVNRPDSIKTCASAEIHNKNMKEKKYARKTKRFEKSLVRAEKRKKRKQRKH
jgi:hypothetical protein